MQNNEEHIDKLFRDKLTNHEVAPPAEVWNLVVANLDTKHKKRRLVWFYRVAGAAVLVMAFLSGWYFSQQSNQIETFVQSEMSDEQVIHPNKTEQETAPAQTTENVELALQTGSSPAAKTENLVEKPMGKAATGQQPSKAQVAQNTNIGTTGASTWSSSFLKEASNPTLDVENHSTFKEVNTTNPGSRWDRLVAWVQHELESQPQNTELLALANRSEAYSDLTDADRAIIAANLAAMKQPVSREKIRISAVGANVTPTYSVDVADLGQSGLQSESFYATNQVTEGAGYRPTVGAGIQVELKQGKRLSLQTGLNYSTLSSDAGAIGVSFVNHDWLPNRSSEVVYAAAVNDSKSSVEVASTNMSLNTSNGIVNIDLPAGTQASAASLSANNVGYYSGSTSYDLDQRAAYLEVPLLLKYRLWGERFGLDLLGGVNTHFLISNEVRLKSQQNTLTQGQTEGLAPITFSGNMGLGVGCQIGNNLNISMQPIMKLYLNSINTQTGYDIKPLSVGVYSGISWIF
jgi:hypothetical protein